MLEEGDGHGEHKGRFRVTSEVELKRLAEEELDEGGLEEKEETRMISRFHFLQKDCATSESELEVNLSRFTAC